MLSAASSRKLFLLDAYALIYRAYFAFSKNPRINSKGQNTSAAFGFTNVLIDILKTEKPTHIAVVFDPPGGSISRQAEFEDYKSNRDEMPEDIRSMIQPIKRIVEAFNIPIIEVAGYEADDVIGTLSSKAEKEGFLTYMMTPDKDYGQLVTEKSLIYKPGRSGNSPEILGVKEVCKKFEVENPSQVIDILGLWGDASDNIPGIPGIGEKTAKHLIKIYGSVENLIDNVDQLKGKQQENVRNFANQGRVSKMLATIITDVEVDFDEKVLLVEPVNADKIREVFSELEFVALAKRIIGDEIIISSQIKKSSDVVTESQLDLFGSQSMLEQQETAKTASYKTIVTERPSYHLISTADERKELVELLLQRDQVCFDTETTDIDALHADLVGFSFSYKAREAFYVSVPNNFQEAKKIVEEFKPFFESKSIEKIAHNIKYDLKVLNRYSICVSGPTFDTMIAQYLINPESKQSMDYMANYYLAYQPISIETLIGKKGKTQGNLRDVPPDQVADYACEDADITFQLKQILEPEIQKEHLKKLFYEIEMPLVEVLKDMEKEGIAIDIKALQEYSKELESALLRLDGEIKTFAGINFNIDSPKQLGEVLFEHLKISNKAKKTKSGQYATSEDILIKHEKDHPIVPLILEFRQLRKLKSTYVDPLPTMCDSDDGRIHTNFMQTVTATGRLSSNNPNLQNIPIRSEKGKEIRKAFVPRSSEYQIMSADYSQIELRIIAALSRDKSMTKAFQEGADIHAATAAKVFNVSFENVTRDQRSAAKAVNFGIIYGQSAFGLSQALNISRTEAKSIIDSYFNQFRGLKSYMDSIIHSAREKGYVETIMKRRRYLPDINSSNAVVRGFAERNAINAPIQGSAADIIKIAMISVHKSMKEEGVKSKMILQVHDELLFDVHVSEKILMQVLVKESMEKALNLQIPMEVEMEMANNWLDAH
ncbi:MAG: DNA polymerase I [Bacteroidetes bacterium]|nr:DNA polymerase I [Bacteroidota bacterium]